MKTLQMTMMTAEMTAEEQNKSAQDFLKFLESIESLGDIGFEEDYVKSPKRNKVNDRTKENIDDKNYQKRKRF
jgi:hypothetical protein